MYSRLESPPEWVVEETRRLSKAFLLEGDPDDEITDEEYDNWMWEHASEKLKAYWDSHEVMDDEPHGD